MAGYIIIGTIIVLALFCAYIAFDRMYKQIKAGLKNYDESRRIIKYNKLLSTAVKNNVARITERVTNLKDYGIEPLDGVGWDACLWTDPEFFNMCFTYVHYVSDGKIEINESWLTRTLGMMKYLDAQGLLNMDDPPAHLLIGANDSQAKRISLIYGLHRLRKRKQLRKLTLKGLEELHILFKDANTRVVDGTINSPDMLQEVLDSIENIMIKIGLPNDTAISKS